MSESKFENSLHWAWRSALAVVGAMLLIVSVAIFWKPPFLFWERPLFEIEAKVEAINVQVDLTSYCIAFLVAGIALLLVAANGRKFSRASKDGIDFDPPSNETVKKAEEASQEITPMDEGSPLPEPVTSAPPDKKFVDDDQEYEVFRRDHVPMTILGALSSSIPNAVSTLEDLDYAFRRTGKGNHAWFLKTKDGKTFKVSFGGYGKTQPTVDQPDVETQMGEDVKS